MSMQMMRDEHIATWDDAPWMTPQIKARFIRTNILRSIGFIYLDTPPNRLHRKHLEHIYHVFNGTFPNHIILFTELQRAILKETNYCGDFSRFNNRVVMPFRLEELIAIEQALVSRSFDLADSSGSIQQNYVQSPDETTLKEVRLKIAHQIGTTNPQLGFSKLERGVLEHIYRLFTNTLPTQKSCVEIRHDICEFFSVTTDSAREQSNRRFSLNNLLSIYEYTRIMPENVIEAAKLDTTMYGEYALRSK